ncbi:hypothetical protein EO087_04675 [Dyella sp. M7H15-1]|nr:hypothetical protein EO087_04675 [Dyella sp. M7H15-1]
MQVLGFGLLDCPTPLRRLYPFPVRRTRMLPAASFRRPLAEDSLAVRLDPSSCRAGSGLSPVNRSSRHHSETNRPGTALRAMPGAPKAKGCDHSQPLQYLAPEVGLEPTTP